MKIAKNARLQMLSKALFAKGFVIEEGACELREYFDPFPNLRYRCKCTFGKRIDNERKLSIVCEQNNRSSKVKLDFLIMTSKQGCTLYSRVSVMATSQADALGVIEEYLDVMEHAT